MNWPILMETGLNEYNQIGEFKLAIQDAQTAGGFES